MFLKAMLLDHGSTVFISRIHIPVNMLAVYIVANIAVAPL